MIGHFSTETVAGKQVEIATDGSCLVFICESGYKVSFDLPPEADPSAVPNSVSFNKTQKLLKVKLPVLV